MEKTDVSTWLDGFDVELTFDGDGISTVTISKGMCASSLTLAEAMGYIEDCDDRVNPIKVNSYTLEKIRIWAESHGY